MAMAQLPQDFKEFLRLLKEEQVRYLLVGGYAVGYYGYPRATADMDVWIAVDPNNAQKVTHVLNQFGMNVPGLSADLFLKEGNLIRLGHPPICIEIRTSISGVAFGECYSRRHQADIGDEIVDIISFSDLLQNKRAAARHKDLDDLDHLSKP